MRTASRNVVHATSDVFWSVLDPDRAEQRQTHAADRRMDVLLAWSTLHLGEHGQQVVAGERLRQHRRHP